MVVGTLQVEIEIPGAASLKDKRRLVRSIKDRCQRHMLVSAAETGALDVRNRAILGFAVVSNSGSHAGAVLDSVERFVRSSTECEVLDVFRIVGQQADLAISDEIDTQAIDAEMLAYAEASS